MIFRWTRQQRRSVERSEEGQSTGRRRHAGWVQIGQWDRGGDSGRGSPATTDSLKSLARDWNSSPNTLENPWEKEGSLNENVA